MSSRPRIRTLKPETWHDEKVGRLTRDTRMLFVVLVTLADDDGRFRAMPSILLGHGYPYDTDAPRKIASWLEELADTGLVRLYTTNGVPYGHFPKWADHQKVNRKTDSTLPPPPPLGVNGHGELTESSVRNAGVTQ